jgi:hypothetical protein
MITIEQAMAEKRKEYLAAKGIIPSTPEPRGATGPRTPEGKQSSSRNATKHGLTARKTVLPNEDQAEFDKLLASVIEDRKAEGELETQFATEIASCLWRLDRARRYESQLLKKLNFEIFVGDTDAGRGFDRLLRYTGSIERELNRAILRLQQLQAERRKQQPAAPPKAMAATACAASTPAPEFVSSTAPAPGPQGLRRTTGARATDTSAGLN